MLRSSVVSRSSAVVAGCRPSSSKMARNFILAGGTLAKPSLVHDSVLSRTFNTSFLRTQEGTHLCASRSSVISSAKRQSSTSSAAEPVANTIDDELEEDGYYEHDADVGIPCTFIEFPGLQKTPSVTKPFSLLGFGDKIPPTFDKDNIRASLSDYLSCGGRVVRIHHGYEAAIFEELVNQSVFQHVNPDDLTLILPISTIEAVSGRPARSAPIDPIPFNDELYQQRLKERCPHFVPFRAGYAFEKIIHDLTLKIDGRDLEKELGIVSIRKYDDDGSTPSFLLADGVEPKKDSYTTICQPAGRYMGDRILDKIRQVTSHLSSESVDILMLDELDEMPYQYFADIPNFIMEAFFQFELAIIDGKARGYGLSTAFMSRPWNAPTALSMYKVLVISNFAAELARLHRGLPTKDPDFHPQQWSLVTALLNDMLLTCNTEDGRSMRTYIETGLSDDLKEIAQTANIKDSVDFVGAMEARENEALSIRAIRTAAIDDELKALEYDPNREMTLEQVKAFFSYGYGEDDEVLAQRLRADVVYKKRQNLLYAARRARAVELVSQAAAEKDDEATQYWKEFLEGESNAAFCAAMGVTVSNTYRRSAEEEIAASNSELNRIADSIKGRDLPRTALALATGISEVPGFDKKNIMYRHYAEYTISKERIMRAIDAPKVDIDKLLNGAPITRDRVFRDPAYIPHFLRNVRASNLLALETAFNIFTPQLVRTRTYPSPANPHELLTPHEYVIAHGMLLMTNSTTSADFRGHIFRMESIPKSSPDQLKRVKQEATMASSLLRTLERSYPYMARDCGYDNLPPPYALWPASIFLMKADKMVYHSRFEILTHRELLPAALGALREIQHIPIFAEYSKQFRAALQRFTTSQYVALQQTVAPVVAVLEDFVDETCPSLSCLPTLECKLYALSLALNFDSVAMSSYESVKPLLDLLDAEREEVRKNHNWESGEDPEYPLLPSCVPSQEEAFAFLDAISAHMHAEISQRLSERISLCIDDVLQRAKSEPPVPPEVDIFVAGEHSVQEAPLSTTLEARLERSRVLAKFQSRHNLYLFNDL